MKQLSYIAILLPLVCFTGSVPAQNMELERNKFHNAGVINLEVSPNGKWLIHAYDDGTVLLSDLNNTGAQIQIGEINRKPYAACFHPSGEYFLVGNGNIINLYNIKGEYLNKFSGHATDVWSISFNPDGSRFVSGSFDKGFRLWDFEEKKLLYSFKGHNKSTLAVAYSNDGSMIASGSLDQLIRVWNTDDNSQLVELTGHTGNIYSIVFSPDDSYMASGSRDQTVNIWDVKSGKLLRTLKGHNHAVFSVRYTANGKHLVSASVDGSVKLWDATNGECMETLIGHKDAVNDLEWSGDFNILYSGSADKRIITWNLGPRFFVDYYYRDDLLKEKELSGLFASKKQEESTAEYRKRMEQAEILENKLYETYFVRYKEMISEKKIIEEK